MMTRKSIIGAVVGLLLLSGLIGANLVMAAQQMPQTSVGQSSEKETSDGDNLDCPAQGLPACQGQMNDDRNEGPENEAEEKNEGPENEADDKNEAAETGAAGS